MANEPTKPTRKTTPKAAPKTTTKDASDTVSAELRAVWAKRYHTQSVEQSESRSVEERLETFEAWDGDATDLLEEE